MSLINDALKRAKEAQQQKPADNSGGPPLRPVERRPPGSNNLWLMLAFAVVVAVAAILLWQWFQQRRQPQTVAANPPSSTQNLPTPRPAPQPTTPSSPLAIVSVAKPAEVSPRTDVPVEPVPSPPGTPRPAVASQPADAAKSATTGEGGLPSTNGQALASVATNEPVADAAPKPAPLKLQGIIFHPTRPSVVINGKLLFVGDRFGEWRVTGIEPQSATLASGGKTNVLTLE